MGRVEGVQDTCLIRGRLDFRRTQQYSKVLDAEITDTNAPIWTT